MRVLIVGCGYVGIPLGAELARAGHEVFGLRRSVAARTELEAAGIQLIVADIARAETLARLPAAYDWVINCAATGGGSDADYRQTYLEGNRNLIRWLGATPPRAFVYTSSTSVYGQNDGSVVDEASPTEPAAETARVLVAAEELLRAAARDGAVPATILRLAGIYGPGRGYWFKRFLSGEGQLEGRGERVMSLVHRDDVVGAVLAALNRATPGAVYNVADDEPVTQLEFYRWLAVKLNRPMPPFAPAGEVSARRRGATNKRVSNRRLKTELGYQFKFPTFREGCTQELDSLQSANLKDLG